MAEEEESPKEEEFKEASDVVLQDEEARPPAEQPAEEATEQIAEPPAEQPLGEPAKQPIEEPGEPSPRKEEVPPPPPLINQDALSMEFLYYGSVLKEVATTISQESDRKLITPWIRKLFRPEYQTSKLKEKRNRYLSSLTCNLLNDEVTGVFENKPPEDALEDINAIKIEPSLTAKWEQDRMWQEALLALPDDFVMMGCSVHASEADCKQDHSLDRVLDQEFQFLLFLTRPYGALLPAEDKTRTAAWLQTLCTIHGEACSSMKAIRNDYIMALLGYLHDLRIVGPFVDYPPVQLKRLDEAAKEAAKTHPVIDPTGHDANQFLLDQPVPDDGAFCYMALTGDLVASNL